MVLLASSPAPSLARPWVLGGLVGLGLVGAVSQLHPVTTAALALTSLLVATGAMCSPPGERLLRARGVRGWAGQVLLLAAALVAAAGVGASSGTSVLLLWGLCLAGAWLFLDRPGPAGPLAGPAVPLDDRLRP